MKEHLTIANSPLMFVLCSIVILFVVVQAVLFMRRAWKHGTEIGLDKGIMKSTVTGSALFSIVPSIPILIILVMLMSVLGNYFPWLRLSVIGSSSYENVAANIAARSFGLLSYTDEGLHLFHLCGNHVGDVHLYPVRATTGHLRTQAAGQRNDQAA